MNSGLPSLLDAIFGKQDLALISLDEIYEVIREFPSFNAGHFLLAKKLKLQDDPGYEKETMRTSLYFNNPFWLQSLLDEVNHFQPGENLSRRTVPEEVEDQLVFEEDPEETLVNIQEESNYTFESYTPVEIPVAKRDELDEEAEEILDEKLASDPVRSEETFQYAEPGPQTVTSFDELMEKYNIQPLDMVDETAATPETNPVIGEEVPEIAKEEATEVDIVETPEFANEEVSDEPVLKQEEPEIKAEALEVPTSEFSPESKAVNFQDEGLEEVINEYGIFEERVARNADHDHDQDAFDQPLDQIPFVSGKITEEVIPVGVSIDKEDQADEVPIETEKDAIIANESVAGENAGIIEHVHVSEYQDQTDLPHKTDEHDYDAFDKPIEEAEPAGITKAEYGNSNELSGHDPDDTGKPAEYKDHSETEGNGQMQEMSQRFEEQQKSLSAFNAKNADSIVFTPYHMVDYFASQGIKLVLEDNPPDQFGKQLKSFTDWLKVMKKLPLQTTFEKQDEKDAEQIRHFAAHSIEERDILTESMAEVLAKQGMFENAIALFQKLSLLYPPKSAYFASRIEQLKAFLQ